MKLKNTLVSSALLASVAAFPALAQDLSTTDTETDVVSPTERGMTNPAGGTTADTTGSAGDVTPVLPGTEVPNTITPDTTVPEAASPGTTSPNPVPGYPTGGSGSTSAVPPRPDSEIPTQGATTTDESAPELMQTTTPDTSDDEGNVVVVGPGVNENEPDPTAGVPTVQAPVGYELFTDTRRITVEELTGQTVYGINDETISTVSDFVLAPDGTIVEVVLDVGGFLGFGSRPVAVPFEHLQIFRSADEDIRVYLPSTAEQLEALPEYVPQAHSTTATN